jgi:phosphoribosylanthranilate isomerase
VPLLEDFLNPAFVSLKICGVTLASDADQLVALNVPALGANFWPKSKRYLAPENAAWLKPLAGKILRVGVFVNEAPENAIRLYEEGFIDLVQLHGDEQPEDAAAYREANVPFIKAIGVHTKADLSHAAEFGARGILLDTHAPGIYGGTGEAFDWTISQKFIEQHPTLPVILAGGIVPENASLAAHTVAPSAIDVASGAELSPGVKDFQKVAALLAALAH